MAKKWILNGGIIRIGNVEYHRELAKEHKTTKGGGFWHFDDETKIAYFYGASSDFGMSKEEEFYNAMGNTKFHLFMGDAKGVVFSQHLSLEMVLEDIKKTEAAINCENCGRKLKSSRSKCICRGRVKRKNAPIVKERKQGRNELCNCGSGKKFKKCCINN